MTKCLSAAPRTLQEVTALVGEFSGTITYIAGGTDLILALEHSVQPGLIVDLSAIHDLDFVDIDEERVRIGAATTMSALARHPALAVRLPVLAEAARQVGSVQIRNRATIGGNIASAVPAGDLLPVLKCLDCSVEVLRRDGTTTRYEFDETVIGPGETCLGDGDMIVAGSIPLPFAKNRVSAFGKIGRRTAPTIARISLAVCANYAPENSRINDIRIVAGAIGPVPLRLYAVEQRLKGRIVDQMLADDFLNALTAAVDSAIPGRYSQNYKRRAVMGLGLDLMAGLFSKEFAFSGALKESA